MVAKTTHDLDAATRTREWKKPVKNETPTTHEQNAERYLEHFHANKTVTALADILSTATDPKTDAVKAALAGESK